MQISKIATAVFCFVFITYGCKKTDTEQVEEQIGYDRGAMLQDITDNVIMPAHKAFVEEATVLSTKLSALNGDVTITKIVEAQQQWKNCAVAWRACEAMNIGEVREAYIHNKVYTWPANTDFINSFISGVDDISNNYIENKGSSSKGLAAIEYLLFNDAGTSAVLDSLTTVPRKHEYLKALGQNLLEVAKDVNRIWASSGSNYQERFVKSTGTEFGSSTHYLVNEMVALLERMLATKLGKPLGKTTDNNTHVDLLEAYRSGNSLELYKSNLYSLRQVYQGGANNASEGIDDYLDAVGATYDNELLTEKIEQQFVVVQDKLDAISGFSLKSALQQNPAAVELLYEETKMLLVLFKVDVISNLSITLVLNDNDGD